MILAWIAIFFILMCLVVWLLLFPTVRSGFGKQLSHAWQAITRHVSGRGARMMSRVQASSTVAQRLGTHLFGALRRHRGILLLAIVLLTVPALLIVWLRQTVTLDGYNDADDTPHNPLIAQLLRGERLLPPQPLPPDVFTTAEVRRMKPEIVTADRKWSRLDDDLQQRVLAVYRVMREQYGYEMVLTEGYRSPERQAALPKAVTRAGPWQSCHQYGLAVDSAVFKDGKLQWDLGDGWVNRGYMLYGQLAKEAGLQWGGDWQSIKDYPHVEKAGACRSAKNARQRNL